MVKYLSYKIRGGIYRRLARIFNYRPTSSPYISGDGFRAMANHVYDETRKCEANKINRGDIVFLKADLIYEWFKNIHPKVKFPYKLITHNSDNVVGKKESYLIDSKIIYWFAQNNTFRHEKIIPIPIGIENKRYYMSGWILEKMAQDITRKKVNKKNRLLFGFSIYRDIPDRIKAFNSIKGVSIADEIKGKVNNCEYFNILNQYKFVLSPQGNGPDCHRTWESLYLNTIPITTKNHFINTFIDIGIPIKSVDDWQLVKSLEEETIISDYDFIMKKNNHSALYLNYWKNIIYKI